MFIPLTNIDRTCAACQGTLIWPRALLCDNWNHSALAYILQDLRAQEACDLPARSALHLVQEAGLSSKVESALSSPSLLLFSLMSPHGVELGLKVQVPFHLGFFPDHLELFPRTCSREIPIMESLLNFLFK